MPLGYLTNFLHLFLKYLFPEKRENIEKLTMKGSWSRRKFPFSNKENKMSGLFRNWKKKSEKKND